MFFLMTQSLRNIMAKELLMLKIIAIFKMLLHFIFPAKSQLYNEFLIYCPALVGVQQMSRRDEDRLRTVHVPADQMRAS